MTTAQTSSANQNKQPTPIPFGTRLKSARETMGLERKEAALKLNLTEKVILMMEKDRYPVDLPVTFIRGYLRAYSKLLQIPDHEVKKAIEPIKAKATSTPNVASTRNFEPVAKNNYFMQIFTVLVILTMISLVSMWWYTHTNHSRLPIISHLSDSITNNREHSATKDDHKVEANSAPSSSTTSSDSTATSTTALTQDAEDAAIAPKVSNATEENTSNAENQPLADNALTSASSTSAENDHQQYNDENAAKDHNSDYSDAENDD